MRKLTDSLVGRDGFGLLRLFSQSLTGVTMVKVQEKVKVAQLCLTLCDPMDYTAHEILQARILEWVAFPFSRVLPNPEIESRSPAFRADSLPAEPQNRR